MRNGTGLSGASRREFLKTTGRAAATVSLTAAAIPRAHAAGDETIRVALVGCGGRGTGAAANALSVPNGGTRLVAMADVFEHRLAGSLENLKKNHDASVDVPEDRRYVGFDAYRRAMDSLRAGDIVILATPPAFRWVHFTYAIEKGLHAFMEKPVTVDGPTSRRMFALGEESVRRNLKVGVGLMCRHCDARMQLLERIRGGEIGEILLLRAYRMAGPTGSAATGARPEGMNELLYQVSRFHAFLWASGGAVSDFLIHNIDECCWMKDAWPVEAIASGGRHYRGDHVDQNFDTYSIEYTFADGTKLHVNGRTMPGCHPEFASYAHGAKGSAVISASGHSPAKCRIFRGHRMERADVVWSRREREPSPYQLEWNHLLDAIRSDKPYNEVKRGVEASLVTSMGRMAAHTGQRVTYDDMLSSEHEFAPTVDRLSIDGPAPLVADATGKYSVPQPGLMNDREY
ncbi:MAG: Gfo/Idh/MocA family oxidoreductase [Planctomycetes bacterium]|nr:Gfo/Idh/MocA family oxidoreductase [Planctomycetota bacterium]